MTAVPVVSSFGCWGGPPTSALREMPAPPMIVSSQAQQAPFSRQSSPYPCCPQLTFTIFVSLLDQGTAQQWGPGTYVASGTAWWSLICQRELAELQDFSIHHQTLTELFQVNSWLLFGREREHVQNKIDTPALLACTIKGEGGRKDHFL